MAVQFINQAYQTLDTPLVMVKQRAIWRGYVVDLDDDNDKVIEIPPFIARSEFSARYVAARIADIAPELIDTYEIVLELVSYIQEGNTNE